MGIEWLMLVLTTVTGPPAEANVPCTFARSGDQAMVTLASHEQSAPDAVVLRAFGRRWCEPAPVRDVVAEFAVPTVKRPVVFAVTSAERPAPAFAELVVYPRGQAPFREEDIRIHAAGAPLWFREWAQAIGISVHLLDGHRELASLSPSPAAAGELLVVGSAIAGRSVSELLDLSKAARVNVLVLDAAWYGPPGPDSLGLEPAQMVGPLESFQTQQWARPPVFANTPAAPARVINRRSWIRAGQRPLVEQLELPMKQNRIVVSYLRWERQLGRNDVADDLLLAVLRTAASPSPPPGLCRRVSLGPETEPDVQRCPVLAAAIRASLGPLRDGVLNVVDLRGDDVPPALLRRIDPVLHGQTPPEYPLLILGDDPLLDEWQWLSLDRDNKTILKPDGVVWLPNDTLPPPEDAQIGLMEALTIYGVSLGDEQRRKNDECE